MYLCNNVSVGGKWKGQSVQDEFADLVWREVEVGGEFEPGDGVMGLFSQRCFDSVNEVAAVPFAFTGNTLDVLWINAEACRSGLYDVSVLATKFSTCMHTATERVR